MKRRNNDEREYLKENYKERIICDWCKKDFKHIGSAHQHARLSNHYKGKHRIVAINETVYPLVNG